jgi:hypothetical protein
MPVTVVRNNEVVEYTFVPKEFAETLINEGYTLGTWFAFDENDEHLKLKLELNTGTFRNEKAAYRLTVADWIGGRQYTTDTKYY